MKRIFSSFSYWFNEPSFALSLKDELTLLRSKVAILTIDLQCLRDQVDALRRAPALEQKPKPITAPKKKVTKSVRRVK